MTSYSAVLSSVDADVVATLDTVLITKLLVLLNREHALRLPESAISMVKEWTDKNHSRTVEYVMNPGEGTVIITNEHRDSWGVTIGRKEPLQGGMASKDRHKIQQAFKEILASSALLHIKTCWPC